MQALLVVALACPCKHKPSRLLQPSFIVSLWETRLVVAIAKGAQGRASAPEEGVTWFLIFFAGAWYW